HLEAEEDPLQGPDGVLRLDVDEEAEGPHVDPQDRPRVLHPPDRPEDRPVPPYGDDEVDVHILDPGLGEAELLRRLRLDGDPGPRLEPLDEVSDHVDRLGVPPGDEAYPNLCHPLKGPKSPGGIGRLRRGTRTSATCRR